MRTKYSARCPRSGNWWAVEVPDVRDGNRARTIHTQARRLDQVDHAARDALSIVLETSPDAFDIEVIPVIDEELVGDRVMEPPCDRLMKPPRDRQMKPP